MQFFTVVVLLSAFIACAYSTALPTPSPIPSGQTSYAIITKVIGQASFTDNYDYGVTAWAVYDPTTIKVIPASKYTGKFATGGVLSYDSEYERVLFFPNPISTYNQSATFVFGQPDFITDDAEEITSVDDITFDNLAIYMLDGNEYVYYYNASQFESSTISAITDSTVNFGVNGGTNYISEGYSIAFDPTSNYIYVVDYDCERILYWPSVPYATQAPSGVIGTDTYTDCSSCDDNSDYSCFYDAYYITFDCNGGFYIMDTQNIYYFARNSQTASFGFSPPTDNSDAWDDTNAIAFDPVSCSYLAVASDVLWILKMNYGSGNTPSGVSFALVYGTDVSDDGPSSNTSSLYNPTGVAWDTTTSGYVWVSDEHNNRLIYFNALTAAPSSAPASASSSHIVGASSSNNPSSTNTPSFGTTPSNSPSTTSSPSQGAPASSSASPSFGAGNGNGDGSVKGAGSRLMSWLF